MAMRAPPSTGSHPGGGRGGAGRTQQPSLHWREGLGGGQLSPQAAGMRSREQMPRRENGVWQRQVREDKVLERHGDSGLSAGEGLGPKTGSPSHGPLGEMRGARTLGGPVQSIRGMRDGMQLRLREVGAGQAPNRPKSCL